MLLPRKHPLALSHPLKKPGLCRKREQVEVVSRLIPHTWNPMGASGIPSGPKRHLKSNPGPKAIYQRKQPHFCNDSQVIQILTYIPSYLQWIIFICFTNFPRKWPPIDGCFIPDESKQHPGADLGSGMAHPGECAPPSAAKMVYP